MQNSKWKILLGIVIIAIICFLIYKVGYNNAIDNYQSKLDEISQKLDKQSIPVETKSDTTIIYRTPTEYESSNNVKLNYSQEPSKVNAIINGELVELKSDSSSNVTNDNGVIDMNQSSTVNIDVTDIVNKQLALESEKIRDKYNKPNEVKTGVLIGDKSQYVGIEYEAKLWDVGYYTKIHGDNSDDSYVKATYTVLRW